MKTIAILFAVFFVAVLGHHLTDEQKAKLRKYKESCINETDASPNDVDNARKGEIADNEKLACFFECLLKKIGALTPDGEFNLEKIREIAPPEVPMDKVEELISKCKDVPGSGCEKAHNAIKCFNENKDIIMTLHGQH